jgi:Domain of unknown function DUF302
MSGPTPRLIPFSAERVEWVIAQSYPITLKKLSFALKKPNLLKMAFLLQLKREAELRSYIDRMAGDIGLMILGSVTQGRLLGFLGGPTQAQMFLIGNPLIALTMMRVHAQAGVYAPLRVMFSGDGSEQTTITYDRPSKIFGQWNEPIFRQTGEMLDGKMEALVRKLIVWLPDARSAVKYSVTANCFLNS